MDDRGVGEVNDLFDRFCRGIATGDAALAEGAFHLNERVTVVTSEASVLGGADAVRSFLARYARGTTRYVWTWARREAHVRGELGWLVALGTELTASSDAPISRAYRMTAVATLEDGRWGLTQVHGSSPAHG